MGSQRQTYRTLVGMGLVTQALKDEGIGQMPSKQEWAQMDRSRLAGKPWTEAREELIAARRMAQGG